MLGLGVVVGLDIEVGLAVVGSVEVLLAVVIVDFGGEVGWAVVVRSVEVLCLGVVVGLSVVVALEVVG